MAQRLKDRVKETTTSVGTGSITLGGVSAVGLQTFVAGAGNGETVPYLIDDGAGNWELTWGTIASGPPDTITRGTLIGSSTGSRITFGAGTKTVALVLPAELTLWPGVSPAMAETSVASATTTDLGAAAVPTFQVVITGTTPITGFGTSPNTFRIVRFAGALTLTHNATSLILIPGANRTTAAGDVGIYVSDASGNWREISYSKTSAAVSTQQVLTSGSGATYTTPAGVRQLEITIQAGGGGGGGNATDGTGSAGGTGGNSSFDNAGTNYIANGGTGGQKGQTANAPDGGNGGTGGTGGTSPNTYSIPGGVGGNGLFGGGSGQLGGNGGSSALGGGVNHNTSAIANSGAGGCGAPTGGSATPYSGGGGGGGECKKVIINSPAGTYTYTVGAAGTAGTAGTGGNAGTAGASGRIIVKEIY
jgi:hypothetical protein